MHHDARMYIEVRYDGQTADAVLAVFRDRGTLGTEVLSYDFSFDSPELCDDDRHEAMMCLFGVLRFLQDRN